MVRVGVGVGVEWRWEGNAGKNKPSNEALQTAHPLPP